MTPTINPASVIFAVSGQLYFANSPREYWINFRKNAPAMPQTSPSRMNHGNCSGPTSGNGGIWYHGWIPKKVRDTIVAITEEKISGANMFIEKFPSTISAEKTAPAIGALYA